MSVFALGSCCFVVFVHLSTPDFHIRVATSKVVCQAPGSAGVSELRRQLLWLLVRIQVGIHHLKDTFYWHSVFLVKLCLSTHFHVLIVR